MLPGRWQRAESRGTKRCCRLARSHPSHGKQEGNHILRATRYVSQERVVLVVQETGIPRMTPEDDAMSSCSLKTWLMRTNEYNCFLQCIVVKMNFVRYQDQGS